MSPLDDHAEFILGLIEELPDMTLDEMVQTMTEAKIPAAAPRCVASSTGTASPLKENSVRRGAEAS